jgi:hypothetical protein
MPFHAGLTADKAKFTVKGAGQMSVHGKVSLWTADHSGLPKAAAAAGGPTPPPAAKSPAGFRHFLGDPDPSQQFTIDGVTFDPANQQQRDRADVLLKMLAEIMKVEPAPGFNTDIPSGYTYLLQLSAHDLVDSSLFLSRNRDSVLGLSNVRGKPLQLETIFGGGPIECPHVYETDACGFRSRLRLGQVRGDGQSYGGNTGDFRDIPRARATDVLGNPSYPDALIGDARNDSHAILSQLVVVFHHFQRKLLDKIDAAGNIQSTGSAIVDAQRNFVATQSACALIYRGIIRNDALRKVLHPAVHAAYEAGTVPIADPPQGLDDGPWQVPLEFSFGFFRFGHSMIRPNYSFNAKSPAPFARFSLTDVLNQTSELSPKQMPFEDRWTIDWPRFFGNDPNTVNFSVQIGPWSAVDLDNFVRGQNTKDPGLTLRDLTGSISAQPWSVRALAQALSATHGNLLQSSRFLKGDLTDPSNPPWFGALSDWLKQRRTQPGGTLTDADIATLAADPPIPFFARFEAGLDPDIGGKHLGVLTSIVVADVFYGIFQNDRLLNVDTSRPLAEQLQQISQLAFGVSDGFAGLDAITTMNGLLDFLDDLIKSPAGGQPVASV